MRRIEQALDLAVTVMKNGGSTAMAERTFRDVLRGSGHEDVPAVWRLDLIAAYIAEEGRNSTFLRSVGPISVNLKRASEAAVLGSRVAMGQVDAGAFDVELSRIRALPSAYGRWTTVGAAACTAAAFSRLCGGDWGAFGIALVAAGTGQLLRARLRARGLPAAVVTLICGVLSACLAALGLRLGLSGTAPALMIASVFYMVPGLPLINGFMDLVAQRYLLVGIERILHASALFLVLAIAIAIAVAVFL